MNQQTRTPKRKKEQGEEELKDMIETVVSEIKAELGNKAGINEIEAALLKRQSEMMSKVMEYLVKDQDFSPTRDKE